MFRLVASVLVVLIVVAAFFVSRMNSTESNTPEIQPDSATPAQVVPSKPASTPGNKEFNF